MKQPNRFATYQYKGIKTVIIYIIILLLILAAATAWNLSTAVTPTESQKHWTLFLICFVLCDLVLMYIGRIPLWVIFTQEGIATKGFYRSKTVFKWEEIREAGILVSEHGHHLPFLFLTSGKLTDDQRRDLGVLSTMKNTVTLHATKEALTELKRRYTGIIGNESAAENK